VDDYDNLEQFKNIDFNIYNSLKFFRDNSLAEHQDIIEQYFIHESSTPMSEALGKGVHTVDLLPRGSSIRVSDLNKDEFIKRKCHYVAYLSTAEQL
jgi:hypothetical protein